MHNLHFSGSTNNFKSKEKTQNSISITQNTKLNQYLEKNRKFYKSPTHSLNKSQNISGAQNTFKINIKNKIINNKSQLNAKKIFPLQNIKNIHLTNNKNNYSIKINSIQYQNNLNVSKNNSLSNYLTKNSNSKNANLRRNNTNINLMNKNNNTNINFNKSNINNNIYRKNNLYNLKKNYKKEKSPVIKLKDYLTTDDLIINKNINNRNSSLYPLVITEESKKKNMNDKKSKSKIKKTESVSNTFIKKNNSSIKKLKTSSTSILNKKTNIILTTNNNIKNNSNNTQNKSRVYSNILGNPTSSSGGYIENLSTEKTSGCARLENFEFKIMKEIKELKNDKVNNNDLGDKIKSIFEEAIDYFIPKEYKNVFVFLLKEIYNINKEYLDNIIQYKEMIDNLKIKIKNYENKYNDLLKQFKKNEKELIHLQNKNKNASSFEEKIKRDNSFFKELNAKNIDDLDALYFFDKVEYNQNDEKEIPKLNLEQKYIEKCIQKEIIKRNEENLTPFQKIALQFEMANT